MKKISLKMSALLTPTAKSLVLGGFFGATAYGVAWSVSSASVQAVSLVIGTYLTPLLGAMLAANLGVLLSALLVVGLGHYWVLPSMVFLESLMKLGPNLS